MGFRVRINGLDLIFAKISIRARNGCRLLRSLQGVILVQGCETNVQKNFMACDNKVTLLITFQTSFSP